MKKILLFIPAYNCEKQIIRVLKSLNKNVLKYINEVIIVSNGSKDNTEEVVKDFIKSKDNFKLLKNENNYNLGGSHKVAFDYAIKNNYDYVIVLHGDDQGDINDLVPYLKDETYLKYDSLLGSRFLKGSKLKGYSKFRTFGNRVYNIIFTLCMRKKIYDLGSGLNMYSVKSLKSKYYHKYPDRLTFNCYMLLATKEYKQKIMFFPIVWKEDDQVSNVKMFSQALITLKLALKYLFCGKKYLESEHRDVIIKEYKTKIVR